VIENINHGQFAQTPYPDYAIEYDFPRNLTENLGWDAISAQITPFLLKIANDDQSEFKTIGEDFLEPLVEAMLLEGYYNLKPACYASPEINPEVPTCFSGSPFIS
jgi:hypothetical protein